MISLVLVSRLEDKESEMRKEYSKLHERYTDVRIVVFCFDNSCLNAFLICISIMAIQNQPLHFFAKI